MPFDFNKKEEKYLAIIAGILFFMWGIDLITKLIAGKIIGWFWFCSLSLLIATIVILHKKPNMLLAFLSVSIILQGMWIIDVLGISFFGNNVFGTGYYLLDSTFSKAEIVTTMRHFFLIPLELFAFVFLNRVPKRLIKVIKYIVLFSLGFLLISLPFGPIINLNFVYSPPFNLPLPSHIYFFVYFFFLIITGSIITYLICAFFNRYPGLFNLKHLRKYFWVVLLALALLSIKVGLNILKIKGHIPYFNYLF
jgi:hypothetical protein